MSAATHPLLYQIREVTNQASVKQEKMLMNHVCYSEKCLRTLYRHHMN